MKLATFNVNSIRRRLPVVLDWLARHQPDVLCLQETKIQDEDFPLLDFQAAGYHVAFRGMKAYNGVAVLSRKAPEAVFYGFDDGGEPDEARLIRVVIDGIPIVNTYVPQGYQIDSPKYAYKLDWFKRLRRYFAKHLSPDQPAIWCGDVNVAPEPIDVHSPEKHLTHVCYHEAVRKAYKETVAWGFVDVFRKLHPDRLQYTFWDYRQPSLLEANKGWRIDHILATPPLAARCVAADVDVAPRRGPNPSDHTFLWAEFRLKNVRRERSARGRG
ncbi:exodeoxyribonuclease III [Nitrospira sp. Kam-Ns4a]